MQRIRLINQHFPKNNAISEPHADDLGIVRSEVDGISRYWVAVGPRVMDADYSIVGTDEKEGRRNITPETMKYGTMIDIVLRDSNFNVYYVLAIVGDAKAHTLNMDYKTTGIKNGV